MVPSVRGGRLVSVATVPFVALGLAPAAWAAGRPANLGNRCVTLKARGAGYVRPASARGYRAAIRARRRAGRFRLKPTALGRYMVEDTGGLLISVGGAAPVTRGSAPGPP